MMDFESAAVPYWPARRRRRVRRRLALILAVGLAAGSIWALRHHIASQPMGQRIFDEVVTTVSLRYYDPHFHGVQWNQIVRRYRPLVEAAPTEQQRYELLGRMLATLGDSHTAVYAPAQVGDVEAADAGTLGAVFVTIGKDRVVMRVAPRSPAARAGLRPGYIVAERAPPGAPQSGTRAFLVKDPLTGRSWRTRLQPAGGVFFDAVIPPDIDWGTVAPQVGYLRMASFPNNISRELGWAVSDIGSHPAMVLDLRGNPGGLIDGVLATAGVFLPRGTLVVSGKGRYALFGRRRFVATDDAGIRYGGRLVVLVDGSSESGAEALASSLQIFRRAVIVGEPTAQHVLGVEVEQQLADGGLLRVATLDMRDAHGNELEGRGVMPDRIVARSAADVARGQDPQLRAAIAIAQSR